MAAFPKEKITKTSSAKILINYKHDDNKKTLQVLTKYNMNRITMIDCNTLLYLRLINLMTWYVGLNKNLV